MNWRGMVADLCSVILGWKLPRGAFEASAKSGAALANSEQPAEQTFVPQGSKVPKYHVRRPSILGHQESQFWSWVDTICVYVSEGCFVPARKGTERS